LADPSTPGSVSLTPWRALLVAALFGGLAGWLVVVTANAFDLLPPRIPWSAPIGLVVFAALVGVLAWSTHQRLQVRRERMEPQRAVAFLVLGKASALAGAAVAGGYLGFALMFLTRVDASTPRDRVIRSAVAAVAGVALAIAGLRLERACKVPGLDDDDDDEPPPDPR
jgi:ABC-type Fe3+-siderophore transport system permease subunit